MSYVYTPRQLQTWSSRATAAALWEQVQHLQQQADYWKHRAESGEARMQEHDCQEEQ